MMRHLPLFQTGALFYASATLLAPAQAPAPQLTREQRDAAAAVQAPVALPPVPGQLQNTAPDSPAASVPGSALPLAPRPAAPAPVFSQPVADTPALPATSPSASKMQALDAVTQEPAFRPAPRVSTPADKMPVTTSTSTSGQFIVHGKVFETRSAMSSRCEEISDELRKVLNDKEPHVLPVVVVLNTGDDALKSKGPPISTAITELTHGGFHLQVTVNERAGLKGTDLRKEVVRALLAERILRNHQKIATPEGRLLLPDWVMTGVLQAMDYKASARPSAIFATIFRSGKIYGIEEIIAASPVEMDGLSRTIYETSCCALVLALVDQVEGPQHFNKFLNSLASDPRSERELLDAAFPKFTASASSLNKWWSLQLATLSKPGIAEPFTAADSLKAIEDAILIHYEAKPEEVPQNVKQRPFELPPPLFVKPPPRPVPPPMAHHESPSPAGRSTHERETAGLPPKTGAAAGEAPAPTATEEATGDKPKTALWRRMLFLGDGKEAAKADAGRDQPPAPASPAPAPQEAPGAKPGLFGRLLGSGAAPKKADEPPAPASTPTVTAPAASPQPQPAEKPAAPAAKPRKESSTKEAPPAPKSEPSPAPEPEKASKLNPLNWFRSGKKAEEPKAEQPPPQPQETGKEKGKGKQAALLPEEGMQTFPFARLLSPSFADAWQMLAPAAPRQTVDMLGFLKRKPKEEAKPEAEPPKPTPAPSPAGKPEATAKKSPPRKPRTSNPNSTPAARPKPAPPGGQRTTNPNAKPVPGAAVPKPETPAEGAATAAGPNAGLVPVTLPLEEYKHILKRPDRAEILDRNIATLRALDLRVGTLFRPVVLAYLSAFTDLREGKTKDMDKRIATLHQFALIAYQKSLAVRDYLDFYEANESTGLSGKFDDYLNLPKLIQEELPVREDPISKYLDAIDKEFSE